MLDRLEILRQAQAMAAHAGARQAAIARNIANADTPGYQASDIAAFAQSYRAAGDGFAPRATRPGHLLPSGHHPALGIAEPRPIDGAVSPNGNGVSLEAEMMKAAEVRAQHDMALAVYQSAIGILRLSLGRPR